MTSLLAKSREGYQAGERRPPSSSRRACVSTGSSRRIRATRAKSMRASTTPVPPARSRDDAAPRIDHAGVPDTSGVRRGACPTAPAQRRRPGSRSRARAGAPSSGHARVGGERRGHEEDLRARDREMPVQLGEAQVVADRKTEGRKRRLRDDGRIPGRDHLLTPGTPRASDRDVEQMHLPVDRGDRAVGREEDRRVRALAAARRRAVRSFRPGPKRGGASPSSRSVWRSVRAAIPAGGRRSPRRGRSATFSETRSRRRRDRRLLGESLRPRRDCARDRPWTASGRQRRVNARAMRGQRRWPSLATAVSTFLR